MESIIYYLCTVAPFVKWGALIVFGIVLLTMLGSKLSSAIFETQFNFRKYLTWLIITGLLTILVPTDKTAFRLVANSHPEYHMIQEGYEERIIDFD